MTSLRVDIIAAGRDHTKSKKAFQNQEYNQVFIGLKNVRSKKSAVLKDKRLYSGESKKE